MGIPSLADPFKSRTTAWVLSAEHCAKLQAGAASPALACQCFARQVRGYSVGHGRRLGTMGRCHCSILETLSSIHRLWSAAAAFVSNQADTDR